MSAPSASPRIAVVGRQNVGKSTLVNRLFGRREAIAHDDAGRHARPGRARGDLARPTVRSRRHRRVPARTPPASRRSRASRPTARSRRPTSSCSSSTRRPGSPRRTRSSPAGSAARRVPVLVVANKVDARREEADVAAFHRARARRADRGLRHCTAARPATCSTARRPAARAAGPTREDDGPRAAVRDGRPAERGQVQPVQPARRRGAHRRVRGGGHDARRGRRVVEWPTGPRAVRGHRRACAARSASRASSTTASCAPTEAIERADVAVAGVRRRRGLHGRGQEDRVPRARGRPRAACSSPTSGTSSRRRTARYKRLTRRPRPFAGATVMRTSALTRHGRAPSARRCCSTSTSGGRRGCSTSKVNEVIQQAQRERPAPARRRARSTTRRRSPTGPPTFVLFGVRSEPAGRLPPLPREPAAREPSTSTGVPIRMQFRPRATAGRGEQR